MGRGWLTSAPNSKNDQSPSLMEELAENIADARDDDVDVDALLDRWTGRPELICEDLFRARDPDTGQMEPIECFWYQVQFLHAYFFGDSIILNVYKGRRIGISFVACMAIIIDGLSHPGMEYPIVATSLDHAQDRISDIETLLKSSPLPFDEIVDTNNKGEIILYNGTSYKAYTANPDKIRGISARTVFIDEMAFIEDQQELIAAAMPTVSLGNEGKVVEISTPRVSNDLFIETNKRGRNGDDDVTALFQPTFQNADEIDVTVPLSEQDAKPVRPDMNASAFESQRLSDPNGFAQEYLCQPMSDEYRFLSRDKVLDAQRRGAANPDRFNEGRGGGKAKSEPHYWHPATHARCGGTMIMGVDIAAGGNDKTAVSVFEHVGEHRYLRFHTEVGRDDLRQLDVYPERPENPSALGDYIYRLAENMGVSKVFLDMTGPGEGFQDEVQQRLGKRAQGFNFTDKDELQRMWGDLNYGLHTDTVHLVPDKQIYDQLTAIVKEQSYQDTKPRFSGKDYAEDGRDDLAMSIVLGAYPPNFKADRSTSLHRRKDATGGYQADEGLEPSEGEPEAEAMRAAKHRSTSEGRYGDRVVTAPKNVRFASSAPGRRSKNGYGGRNSRSRNRSRN